MIGIKSIASYIPANTIDNVAQAKKFGETEDFVNSKLGSHYLSRKNSDHDTSDLAVLAVKALLNKATELSISKVDALVVVTQNPDGEGLPHTAAIVQKKLNLPSNIAAFDVSLGCSGYVYGLYILKGFLEASGLENGILVTSDPYSKVINPEDKTTSLLFGDAATATWIGNSPEWILGSVSYGTNGTGSEFLRVTNGILHMNGRRVFNFALGIIADHINELLKNESLRPDDIDLYCLHQGSATIVDSIANKFGKISNRFAKDLEDTGNTVSSSIPLILEKHAFNSPVNRILISGFGVGFSWATALLLKSC